MDPEFNPDPNSTVSSLALQADGQILVSGVFTTLGGQPRAHLARLNADGTLDAGFNPAANSSVYSLAVQADGSILVGGAFTTLGGQARSRLARLNADGTLDPSFSPGADGSVYSLAVQADGKILAAGSFTTLGGEPRSYVGRLNADGTVDPAFPPALNNFVYALAVQADGKTVLGGAFTTLGGLPCNGLARFDPIEPATQSLTCDDSTVTWWRGGTSPEVWQTSFDYSADGLHWTSLGLGTRVSGLPAGQTGGWELAGLSLPPAGTLRARGYVTGGQFNGSAGFVETMLVRPVALRLRLVRDGSNVVLRWPSVMTGYVLESTASLSPSAGWSPVTNQVTIAGSDCITTHGMDSPARFYRLRSR